MIQLYNANLTIGNTFKFSNRLINIIRLNTIICRTICYSKIKRIKIAVKYDRYIGNPFLIL